MKSKQLTDYIIKEELYPIFKYNAYHCLTHDTLVIKAHGRADCKFEKGIYEMNYRDMSKYLEEDCLPF